MEVMWRGAARRGAAWRSAARRGVAWRGVAQREGVAAAPWQLLRAVAEACLTSATASVAGSASCAFSCETTFDLGGAALVFSVGVHLSSTVGRRDCRHQPHPTPPHLTYTSHSTPHSRLDDTPHHARPTLKLSPPFHLPSLRRRNRIVWGPGAWPGAWPEEKFTTCFES